MVEPRYEKRQARAVVRPGPTGNIDTGVVRSLQQNRAYARLHAARADSIPTALPQAPHHGVSLNTTPEDVSIGTCTGMFRLQVLPRSPAMFQPVGGVTVERLSVTELPRPIM